MGRFISADTIIPGATNSQAFNRYAYVLNNPIKYSDPTGHSYCDSPYADPTECPGGSGVIGCTCPTPVVVYPDGGLEDEEVDFIQEAQSSGCSNGCPGGTIANPVAPNAQAAQFLSEVALGFDALGYAASFFEAAIADAFYIGATGVGCYVGDCWGGLKSGFLLDYAITTYSPLGNIENLLGGAALLATAFADYFSGNTALGNNPRIGIDTLVSARNLAAGFIPEANIDLAVSASQFKYDLDRKSGQKSGGYISLSNPLDIVVQVIFKDWW